jgi:hypothetical protein
MNVMLASKMKQRGEKSKSADNPNFQNRENKLQTHHFDSDGAVALARFRKHVAPALSKIP